ncbi:MMPL family protein, partial [Mycobacteroides abscessus MAB_110811_1470]
MSTHSAPTHGAAQKPSRIARFIHTFSVPIILAWLVLTVIVNVVVPQLEEVGKEHSVSLASKDAPSYQAIKRQGELFQQFKDDSMVMVLLENDTKFSTDMNDKAHTFYRELVKRLRADTKHVEYAQDFWGDRITAGGAQSVDEKAAYVQLNLRGDQGTTEGKESVTAVQDNVAKLIDESKKNGTYPDGLKVFVTGQAALTMDMNDAGDKSMLKMTGITFIVITIMLLFIYRSITTVLLILFMVFVELGAPRCGRDLGNAEIIGLSTFAVNLLTSLAIAAGTDYAIFLIGRYQELRAEGKERLESFYLTYHSVSHVILGSGLTIAGATFCLKFTRLPYFESLGVPCAIGMLVVVAASLTIGPAVLLVATKFGLLESKRTIKNRTWRKVGTAIVRWPGDPGRHHDHCAAGLAFFRRTRSTTTTVLHPASLPRSRIPGLGPALLEGENEPGHPDCRGGQGSADSGEHAGAGPHREERLPCRGHQQGAEHDAPMGAPIDHSSV